MRFKITDKEDIFQEEHVATFAFGLASPDDI
jgi:hypothetical protein